MRTTRSLLYAEPISYVCLEAVGGGMYHEATNRELRQAERRRQGKSEI